MRAASQLLRARVHGDTWAQDRALDGRRARERRAFGREGRHRHGARDGTVKETQKKFWSTKDAGQQPFTYQAGVGGVITGWDQGLLGAGVGETRALDIPADEGYGARGFPAWGIPPNGGLLFEIEVLNIKGKGAEL